MAREGVIGMEIRELIREDLMILELKTDTEEAVLDEMIERLHEREVLNDREKFKGEILKEERQASTGIGKGVAIPYAKTNAVLEPAVLFARSSLGIDFDSVDDMPVYLFFMTACPDGSEAEYIHPLTDLYNLLLIDGFIDRLRQADDSEEIYSLIEKGLQGDFGEIGEMEPIENHPFIGVVTSSNKGSNYADMVVEAFYEAAEDLNVAIKVEVDRESGVDNPLSENDIERASGIIVASEMKMNLERFTGKHLIKVPVSEGIRQPQGLLNRIIEQIPHESKEEEDRDRKPIKEKMGKQRVAFLESLPISLYTFLAFFITGILFYGVSILLQANFGDSNIFGFANTFGKRILQFFIILLSGFIALKSGINTAWLPGMIAGFIALQTNNPFMSLLGGILGGVMTGNLYIILQKILSYLPEEYEDAADTIFLPVLGLILTGVFMIAIVLPILNAF